MRGVLVAATLIAANPAFAADCALFDRVFQPVASYRPDVSRPPNTTMRNPPAPLYECWGAPPGKKYPFPRVICRMYPDNEAAAQSLFAQFSKALTQCRAGQEAIPNPLFAHKDHVRRHTTINPNTGEGWMIAIDRIPEQIKPNTNGGWLPPFLRPSRRAKFYWSIELQAYQDKGPQ